MKTNMEIDEEILEELIEAAEMLWMGLSLKDQRKLPLVKRAIGKANFIFKEATKRWEKEQGNEITKNSEVGDQKKMEAILWIYNGKCRVMLKENDEIIDTNDTWNNRASAELMVSQSMPEATLRFVTDATEIQALNSAWQR